MPKPIRIILIVIGSAFGLVLLLWLGIAAYVTVNKKKLLETVTAQLNNNINGKLTIESMEPALLQGFPGISVSLKNVLLRDSLFEKHRHNLLEAKEVFVALNLFALAGGNTEIQKLSIDDGKIYLFTDSLGNSNNKIFTSGSSSAKKEGKSKKVNRIVLNNVSFIQDNQQRKKYFNFDIHRLALKVNYNSKGWKGNAESRVKVNTLAFNLKRGSFIKNQEVEVDLDMVYDSESAVLTIPEQEITIGTEDFKIGGTFRSTATLSDFKLSIATSEIELKNVVPLLARNISSKLGIYHLKNPISAKALIQGSLKQKGDPKILVSWATTDNELTVSGETIRNCSFTGYFDNEFKNGLGLNDRNSVIGFAGVKGSYFDIPFRADTIRIINLIKPIFEGRFQSAFALEKLNAISGSQSFHFHQGQARLNLFYRAPYNKSNSTEPYIYGALVLSNATLNYHPRDLDFTNLNGVFRFKGQDILLQNLRARSANSNFIINGSFLNFLNLYYTDPERIKVDLHVKSPKINVGEFIAFLGRRKSEKKAAGGNKSAAKVFNQLDQVLEQATVHLDVETDKLIFRRFEASDIHSSILLTRSGVQLQDVSLKHADGRLQVKGSIDQSGPINRFNVDTKVINVNIAKLFYAFENFGQDAIAYQNLRGNFNSTTKISGRMKEGGQIIPKSFNGTVSFNIKNGALLNFEPMQKIGNFAFPNRDFSNITFTSLQNTFDINGSTIKIQPMFIQSSVLNLYVEGVYGMPTGTDIALRIPLRNPKKDIGLSDSLKRERFDNGIVINLRGQDDENGNVKFKLGKKDEEKDLRKEAKELEKQEKSLVKQEKENEKAIRKEEKKARKELQKFNE
jgi:hypothetical protein